MKSLILTLAVLLSIACLQTLQGQVPQIITYQGSVAVGGTNYQGMGHFKFALVNGDGTRTYWSNDGLASDGGEPLNFVALPVVDGVYEVLLGDAQDLPGMTPISPDVFANSDVHVRVWFSDGSRAFQRVQPDTRVTAVGYAMLAANVADGAITAAKIAPNAVTAASLAPGTIGPNQLAPGAAAANLQASGGLILSDQTNATSLVQAGFQRIGTVTVDGDQWQSFSQFTPAPRFHHVAVWTGQEMIIWGGLGLGGSMNSGARYNPTTDVWTPVTNRNAVVADSGKAVWTGKEMIVLADESLSSAGSIYTPASDTWRKVSIAGGPTNISSQTLVWTGHELLVWGGASAGHRYDLTANVWTTMSTSNSPSPRSSHTAVWTGTEMILWGGSAPSGNSALNSGARYNPTTDTWAPISASLAPSRRFGHTAVWTGSEMIVWGGYANQTPLFSDTGAAYDPATDTWRKLPKQGEPSPRFNHVAFWTGKEMIVWGGSDPQNGNTYVNSGGRFDPTTGIWQTLASKASPEPVAYPSAVWSGSELII